jgi:hypothetical protein
VLQGSRPGGALRRARADAVHAWLTKAALPEGCNLRTLHGVFVYDEHWTPEQFDLALDDLAVAGRVELTVDGWNIVVTPRPPPPERSSLAGTPGPRP